MYGTIAKYKLKTGMLEQFRDTFDKDRVIDGICSFHIFQSDTDPNEVWMVAIFDDKEKYRRNANLPEQNDEYMRIRELLVEDPVWHDGMVILSHEYSEL